MITFLWMLYLAFTILFSVITVTILIQGEIIDYINNDVKYDERVATLILVAIDSILWSIWYFYYLS